MMKKHSILAIGLSVLLALTACSSGKKSDEGFPPMGQLTADSITVPPILMGIAKMFVTGDILVAFEPQKDTLFSFWQLPQFEYLFCAGMKGGGPNDFIQPDFYFHPSDEGFKVNEIMTHKVKNMQIDKEKKQLTTVGVQSYNFNETVANRFTCLADGKFCFVPMFLNKEMEYALCDDKGNIRYFSPYPQGLLDIDDGGTPFNIYNKQTISHPDGKRFAAFYFYVRLCRVYDDNGNLLHETLLDSPPQPSDFRERKTLIGHLSADEDYIYVLAKGEKEENILEIWDWDGKFLAHYRLDKAFRAFAVYPKNHKLYAVDDSRDDGMVYIYDLPVLKK